MNEIHAAVVQTSPIFGEQEANLAAGLAMIPAGCDLAVLPELATTGYQFRHREELLELAEPVPDGPTCEALREHAATTGTTVVLGLAERDGDRLYNTAVLVRPDGHLHRYRKVHLFWNEWDLFDPGDLGFPVVEACGTTIGVMICFDWLFPEAAGTLARRGARILAHPSNLVLPHAPRAMPVRALENRVYTLTANRIGLEHRTDQPLQFTGLSTIASPRGEVIERAAADAVVTLTADLDLAACDPWLTPRNHVVTDRRPECYDR